MMEPMSRTRKTPPKALEYSTRAVGLVLVVAVLLGAGVVVFGDWYSALPDEAQATYVGRQSCLQCHVQQGKLFQGSHHDLAMDVATPETVLGDFSGVELEHDGTISR